MIKLNAVALTTKTCLCLTDNTSNQRFILSVHQALESSTLRHNAKQMLQQKIFFIFFGQFEIVDGKSFK